MFRSANELLTYSIRAKDEEMGSAHDLFIEDTSWNVRYVVVDTGVWLPGRKVLVPVNEIQEAKWDTRHLLVDLDKEAVENAPEIDADKPVSRQEEESVHSHFAWVPYWNTGLPSAPVGSAPAVPMQEEDPAVPDETDNDPHLRSCRELTGYHIQAQDGEIGHVENMLLDDQNWTIRYFVVDTRNWLPGKRVLVSPQWCEKIDWNEKQVRAQMTRQQIESSPEYDPNMTVDRHYENLLYEHYNFPGYWM